MPELFVFSFLLGPASVMDLAACGRESFLQELSHELNTEIVDASRHDQNDGLVSRCLQGVNENKGKKEPDSSRECKC